MKQRIRNHSRSVQNALNGLFWAFYTQPNFQIHVFVGFSIMIASYLLNLSYVECAILALAIVIVIVCELINTALETFIDLLGSEWQGKSKVAKDVAAGMVLTAALGSVFVGLFIFVPRILNIISIN